MPIWPFSPSKSDVDAARLLTEVVAASRHPALFGDNGAPDTLEGRFELVTLHAALALVRLREAPEAAALAQSFTDKFFRQLDSGLREAGVGDTSVPKRMRKMAGAFYGRLSAYSAALAAGDLPALAAAVGRNVLGDEAALAASRIAEHVEDIARRQRLLPFQALLESAAWTRA